MWMDLPQFVATRQPIGIYIIDWELAVFDLVRGSHTSVPYYRQIKIHAQKSG